MKITRIRVMASVLSIFASLAVASAEMWKVVEAEIKEDESFSVALQAEEQRPSFAMPYTPKLRVVIPKEGDIIQFRRFVGTSQFSLDTSNSVEVEALKRLLADYRDARIPVTTSRPGEGVRVHRRIEPHIKRFSGIEGDFTVKSYESELGIDLVPPPSQAGGRNRGVLTIPEPEGVAYALDNLSAFKQLHVQALKNRDKQMAFQKQQKEKQAGEAVASAKAASDQRMKEFRAAEEGRMLEDSKRAELGRLAEEEERKKGEIAEQVRLEARRKITNFLVSPEGSALDRKIQGISKDIVKKDAEETQYLKQLHATYVEYRKTIAPTPDVELATQQALSNWLNALAYHKDSSSLAKLKADLKTLRATFKGKSGFDYAYAKADDEPIAPHETAETQVQLHGYIPSGSKTPDYMKGIARMDGNSGVSSGVPASVTFGGIGATLEKDEQSGTFFVQKLIEGAPASRAGVRDKDVISAIDGASVQGRELSEVISSIRGSIGSSVDLTIRRLGNKMPLTISIQREKITAQ